MLTGIGLRNFKAFGDEFQEVPLSKITLIYGPNSSGKSSLIQSLLLLKQSLLPNFGRSRELVRNLMPRGDFVDLGSFESLVHRHEKDRELALGVCFKERGLGNSAPVNNVLMTFKSEHKHMSSVRFRITTDESRRTLLDATMELEDSGGETDEGSTNGNAHSLFEWNTRFNIVGVKGDEISHQRRLDFLPTFGIPELKRIRARALEQVKTETHRYAHEHSELSELTPEHSSSHRRARLRQRALERAQERADRILSHAREYNLARTSAQSRSLQRRLRNLNLSVENLISLTPENIPSDYEHEFHLLNYLGPLRSPPQRVYRLSSVEDDDNTGTQGEYASNVIYRDHKVEDRLNWWVNEFEIPHSLTVAPLGDIELTGEHIAVVLTDERSGTKVTIADVGFGISQLLPVVIEGIASREESIICAEEPGTNLHPRLQAKIPDLMIDTIADEPGKRKQWIVETHSELLVRRIQTRIAQGDISPSDVSVLYVDPDDDGYEGSAIKQLRLDDTGSWLDEWPQGFFEEGHEQTMAVVNARMKKRASKDVRERQLNRRAKNGAD